MYTIYHFHPFYIFTFFIWFLLFFCKIFESKLKFSKITLLFLLLVFLTCTLSLVVFTVWFRSNEFILEETAFSKVGFLFFFFCYLVFMNIIFWLFDFVSIIINCFRRSSLLSFFYFNIKYLFNRINDNYFFLPVLQSLIIFSTICYEIQIGFKNSYE